MRRREVCKPVWRSSGWREHEAVEGGEPGGKGGRCSEAAGFQSQILKPRHGKLLSHVVFVVPARAGPLRHRSATGGRGGAIPRAETDSASPHRRRGHVQLPGRPQELGVIADCPTSLLRKQGRELFRPGADQTEGGFLGPVMMDEKGFLQLVRPDHLLTERVREALFAQVEAFSYESD